MNANHGSVIATIVQIDERRMFPGEITWEDGIITRLCELDQPIPASTCLLPGFIDAHVHIESSMLTPAEFARIACRHGTVAALSDPHEIANVLGLKGIDYMIGNAALTPLPIFFGAPACVPATPFETAGASLESEQLEPLFANKSVRYLSEMMNYPGVLNHAPDIIAKLQLAQRFACPIDGHAPGLTGLDVIRYAQAGITTDHECRTLAEAEAKVAAGMHILIREGSAARNFDALHPLISRHPDKVMFCSDDKHPDDLIAGHINCLVARAVAAGHAIFDVLRCACINPVIHYHLPLGQLRVGDRMDAVEVNTLQDFTPLRTWIAGRKVAENNKSLLPVVKPAPINCFNARPITPGDLDVKHVGQKIRVIKALDGELLTEEVLQIPKVQQQKIVADPSRDILLLTVVNRYRPARTGIGFYSRLRPATRRTGVQCGARFPQHYRRWHRCRPGLQGGQQYHHRKRRDCRGFFHRYRITALAYCRTHERFGWRFGGSTLCRTRPACQAHGLQAACPLYDLVLYGAAGDPGFKIKR